MKANFLSGFFYIIIKNKYRGYRCCGPTPTRARF